MPPWSLGYSRPVLVGPRKARPVRLSLIALASAAVVSLSACQGATNSSPSAGPTSVVASPSGSAKPSSAKPSVPVSKDLDALTVTGVANKSAKVAFKAPWAIDKTQTRVIGAGSGVTVAKDSTVEINYVGINGRTGKEFDSSFARKQTATFSLAQVVPGFQKGLAGQKVGSRVLIAMPGADGYDSMGGNAQIDIQVGDSLIFVVDIIAASYPLATGSPVTPKAGLPTVTLKNGVPDISIPAGAKPPTSLQIQPLIKGPGRAVLATDTVTLKYQGRSWKTGKVIEQSYQSAETAALAGLIPGFVKGLTNQTVGSRVLLVIPPADAYPEGNKSSPQVEKGDTIVYVVDILFAQKTA